MQNQQSCSIERSYLIAALKSASRFCGKPTSYLSNINNVLLRFDGERLVAAATDLDQSGSVCAPAQGQPFALAVNPGAALEWLAKIKSDAIGINLPTPERIEFSADSQRSRITLPATPADEFPAWPDVENADVIRVQAIAFIEAVLPFAPKDSRRTWQRRTPAIHLRVQDQTLILAACDGARFHRQNVPCVSAQTDDDFQFAVAPTALANLVKVIAENDFGDVELTIRKSEKYVCFYAASGAALPLFSVTARLLNVPFDIEKIQSNLESVAGSFTVETKALTRALRRLSRISKEDNNRVELHTGQGIVELRARSADSGQALEEVPADLLGEGVGIAFDHKQLSEILKAVKAENVLVEYQLDPRKVARVAGVLVVPVEAFAVEEDRRLAKRAIEEAVAAKTDTVALANAIEVQLRDWQQRSIFADVTQAVFKSLDQLIGNNSTWPADLQNLPHDLKTQVRHRIGEELLKRGVLQRDTDTWQVQSSWANAQLPEGEAERREQVRSTLRQGVQESIKNLRNAEKITYAQALVSWHCSAQDSPFPYRNDLSFTEASDVRTRVAKVVEDVKTRFQAADQSEVIHDEQQ